MFIKNSIIKTQIVFIIFLLPIWIIGKTKKNDKKFIGNEILGNWDGKKTIIASATILKPSIGNPAEDGEMEVWGIHFENSYLKPFNIGCCSPILINEGDLDSNGTDELSIYQAPLNSCVFTFSTYTFYEGNWVSFCPPVIIPDGCNLNEKDLQDRLIHEPDGIYIYENNLNDDNFKLIKKPVNLKKIETINNINQFDQTIGDTVICKYKEKDNCTGFVIQGSRKLGKVKHVKPKNINFQIEKID